MKRVLILILAVLLCMPSLVACGGSSEEAQSSKAESSVNGNTSPASKPSSIVISSAPGETSGETSADSPASMLSGEKESESLPATSESDAESSSAASSVPEKEEKVITYGVYNLISEDGNKLCLNGATNSFVANHAKEEYSRFTLHVKTVDGKAYLGIYQGDDEQRSVSVVPGYNDTLKLFLGRDKYNLSNSALWIVEDLGDGYCRLIPHDHPDCCITVTGKNVTVSPIEENNKSQRICLEKAPESTEYAEFVSDKGNFVVRIPPRFITRKICTKKQMEDYANFMQEAMDAEIELTGYQPYDIIVIKAWMPQDIVAGVVNNYNHITVNNGFMEDEMSKLNYRDKTLGMKDLSFAMLHEMGHMFDSNRAWNFESEAWTDLKLCYVLYKLTLDHKDTDGYIFGCASSDFGKTICYTYETMADGNPEQNGAGGLNVHVAKGAMETVYGFFGAARLFLLMTYDFGWEPFIQTFHWYQDNGYDQSTFDRWTMFTTFVDRLSEYSGKDIKNEYLSENNWKIFDEYYHGRTTDVV